MDARTAESFRGLSPVDEASGAAAGGKLVQMKHFQTGAVMTGTTQTFFDDTIPQNTEGNEIMTLAITPASASNRLLIATTVVMSSTVASDGMQVMICQDAIANALAAVEELMHPTPNLQQIITFTHEMAAGTTISTTFKVRAGGSSPGTKTFNGVSGSRRLGGVQATSITIMEIEP